MNNKRTWKLYLSGEIHTNWRNEIQSLCTQNELPVIINSPNTKHSESDDCGVTILGGENDKFWHDRKGAAINSIRNTVLIKETDILFCANLSYDYQNYFMILITVIYPIILSTTISYKLI